MPWSEAYGPRYVDLSTVGDQFTELKNLESSLSKVVPCIVSNTHQASLEAVLHVLGCSSSLIPIVLPVTASLSTMAAVLRSGALPVLLDVHEDTLQYDPEVLKDVLQDFDKGCIVFLGHPFGLPVDPALLEVCKDTPTIIDNATLPSSQLTKRELVGYINLFRLSEIMMGDGGVVYTSFLDIIQDIDVHRRSVLGLNSIPSAIASHVANKYVPHMDAHRMDLKVVKKVFAERIGAHFAVIPSADSYPFLIVQIVGNAVEVSTNLRSFFIKAQPALPTLHKVPEVKVRFNNGEVPDYPVAEMLSERLIALPVATGLVQQSMDAAIEALRASL